MQLTLHIPSPNQHWDAIHGIIGRRGAANVYLPSEKSHGFSIAFAKCSPVKMFGPPKNSAPYNYDFAKTTNQ